MMTILWWCLFALCFGFGFLGCFINKIPGPIMVLVATLIAMFGIKLPIGWGTVAVVAVLAIGSIIASKVLVKLVKKVHDFSKRGGWGTTIGSIIGLMLLSAVCGSNDSMVAFVVMLLIGLVFVPFVCAFLLELTRKEEIPETVKCATAATSAYLADTFLKLVVFVYATYMLFFYN